MDSGFLPTVTTGRWRPSFGRRRYTMGRIDSDKGGGFRLFSRSDARHFLDLSRLQALSLIRPQPSPSSIGSKLRRESVLGFPPPSRFRRI
ncbi:hypothetical protein TIFTF001_051220 [Ficus carica]|uniref:Uncharacterized protein n=1 Tax=Ficus carica TaxID=3494 RepID=A0AA88CZF4_FICCA|nr:hypothetical protein TIFTF001_051220 [Ficus carica]